MRRLVVALVVVLLALGLSGCGGGGEEAAETPPATTPAATPAPVDPNAAIIEDRSPQIGEVFELLPPQDELPADMVEKLKAKQPMVIMFADVVDTKDATDKGQLENDDVRAQVKAAVDANKGVADLIVYDLGKYRSDESTAVTEVQTKIAEDETAKRAQSLARQIGVDVTPFIIVVDDQGYIIFKWRGVIDRDLMARQVERAG